VSPLGQQIQGEIVIRLTQPFAMQQEDPRTIPVDGL
jgi:hypothetical protein